MAIANQMRAAFCVRPGEMEIREVPTPRPTNPGTVLLRILHCGICGSDLHWFRGHSPAPTVCPGHEASAVVAAVGPGCTSLREGDRVVVEATRSCGQCDSCRRGSTQLCRQLNLLGLTVDGAFADYMVAEERHLFPMPSGLDPATAALTEPLAVGVHGLRLASFEAGQRVLVLGGGTIGLLCVPAAVAAGAGEITVLARREHQQEAARRLGAHNTVGPDGISQGDFDVVLDTVADPAGSLDTAFGGVRAGGSVILLGVFNERPQFDALSLLMREVRLVGSMCYSREDGKADFSAALDILAEKGQTIRDVVRTHRVPLEEISRGFDLAADKKSLSIKVDVELEGSSGAA